MSGGSIHDYDDLAEALEEHLGFGKPGPSPLEQQRRLCAVAERCGWDGTTDITAWACNRVNTYHRALGA